MEYLLTGDDAYDVSQKVKCLVHESHCKSLGNIDLREGATDDDAESMRPTSVHFGGVVCNAWSRQSATRERFVHQSEEAHNAWIGRRRALARM